MYAPESQSCAKRKMDYSVNPRTFQDFKFYITLELLHTKYQNILVISLQHGSKIIINGKQGLRELHHAFFGSYFQPNPYFHTIECLFKKGQLVSSFTFRLKNANETIQERDLEILQYIRLPFVPGAKIDLTQLDQNSGFVKKFHRHHAIND